MEQPFKSEEIAKLKENVNNKDCFEARNLNVFTNYVINHSVCFQR